MAFQFSPPTGLNDVTNFPNEDPLIRSHIQSLIQQIPTYVDAELAKLLVKLDTIPKRYIMPLGTANGASVLYNAWFAMAGTGSPSGTFLVTIRDLILNDFYTGIHNYAQGAYHNSTKTAGGLIVATNNVGTVSTTTGTTSNQEYTIQLISRLT